MKNMRTRNFEDTKSLIKTLVVLAVICCLASLFFTQEGSSLQLVLMVLTLVFMVAAIVVVFLYSRCPSCGKVIAFGVLKATCCPRCKRNLVTGQKMKKKSR